MHHRGVPAWATGRRTLAAVALLALALTALTVADGWLFGYDAATKLDLRFGYDHAEVIELFRAYGVGGRRAYGVNLGIDTVYPLVLAAAVVLVSARAFGTAARWLWVAPIAFAVLDVIENALFGTALLQFPDVAPRLVSVASPITQVKLVSFVPTVVLGVAALLVLAFRAATRRRRPV
jgi:hypothetical protein